MEIFLATALENQNPSELEEMKALRLLLDAEYGEGSTFLAAYEFPTPDRYLPPAESLSLVLDKLQRARFMVLYFPRKVASSAILELGYALSWGKPVLAFTESPSQLPYMVRDGAPGMTISAAVKYPDVETAAKSYFERIQSFVEGLF